MNLSWDVVVAGAGPAGCAAAGAARASGADVLLIELAERAGGALAAMGLLHGRDDAAALVEAGVRCCYQTALLGISPGLGLRLLSPSGACHVAARAVVLATGGREQTRGNLALPGTRPAGVLTAGAALRLLAATARLPGRQVVIAGDGRWGDTAAAMLERAGAAIVASVAAVAQVEGWPRVTSVLLDDGRPHTCDLLVLATPLLPWLPPALAGGMGLPGVFVAGSAALADLDANGAATAGASVGRQAADWALRESFEF